MEERSEFSFKEYDELFYDEYGSQPAILVVLQKVNVIVDKMEEKITKLRDIIDRKKLFLKLRFNRIPIEYDNYCIAAIDSTFPPEGLDLIGGKLSAIVAGYILYGCRGKRDKERIEARKLVGDLIFLDTEEFKEIVYTKAKILEKKLAQELLTSKEKGLLGLDQIIFDGEIVPYKLIFSSIRRKERKKRLSLLEESVKKSIREAEKTGTTIIGVLKRSYSRLISAIVEEKIPINDKALMSIALKNGEYTCIGKLREVLPKQVNYMNIPEESKPKYHTIVEENLRENPEYGEIEVCFYKPYNPTSFNQAVKIEILDYGGIGTENIIAFLSSKTSENAVPYFIDIIDSLVRLEAKTLEVARRKLEALLARNREKIGIILSGHTNPQKRYLSDRI